MVSTNFPIVDSHIHLLAATHLEHLNWTGDLPSGHPLKRQCSVADYRAASNVATPSLSGFIFVETDRKYNHHIKDYDQPLQEIAFFSRIVNDDPKGAEGHCPGDRGLALAMVPWAPMVAGPQAVREYIVAAERMCHDRDTFRRIRGFRVLLQNQPRGTMLAPDFLDSMSLLQEQGYAFDLTIDCHSVGTWQIMETIQMLQTLNERGKSPVIILDHCCKPDLTVSSEVVPDSIDAFRAWARGMQRLAEFPKTVVKLSGLLCELSPDELVRDAPRYVSIERLVRKLEPWTNVLLQHFGPQRILFGSDWPVCTVPVVDGWSVWHDCVAMLLDTWKLRDDEKADIWSGNAVRVYGLEQIKLSRSSPNL